MKIDLTSDEVFVGPAATRGILHPYSDTDSFIEEVRTYTMVELLAEKIRALVERCRPRDLYDVVNIYRHPDLIERPQSVHAALTDKCRHAGIEVPDAAAILASPFRTELDSEPTVWSLQSGIFSTVRRAEAMSASHVSRSRSRAASDP